MLTTDIQANFFELLAEKATIQELANYAADLIGTPLCFTDGAFNRKIFSNDFPVDQFQGAIMPDIEDENKRAAYRKQIDKIIIADDPYIVEMDFLPYRLLYLRITFDDYDAGFIIIPEFKRNLDNIDQARIRIVQRGFSLASRVYELTSVKSSPERMLFQLISGIADSKMNIDNCSTLTNMNENEAYCLMAVKLYGAYDPVAIRHELVKLCETKWVTYHKKVFAVLFDASAYKDKHTQFMPKICDLLKTHYGKVCLSDQFDNLLYTKNQYDLAVFTLSILNGWEDTVVYSNDYKIRQLLHDIALEPENLMRYCDSAILQMLDYDRESETDYVLTLQTLFQYNKSPSLAAKALFIHKNTLIYRMERIRELFGVNIEKPMVWLNICFSLQILNTFKALNRIRPR